MKLIINSLMILKKINKDVEKLYADEYVKNKKGIFKYVLGGSKESRLLEIRIFEERDKRPYMTVRQKKQ